MALKGRLDKDNLEQTIANMDVGQEGYVEPEALIITHTRESYLDTSVKILSSVKQPKQYIRVKRTGSGKNAYDVDISSTQYVWKTVENPHGNSFAEMLSAYQGSPIVCLTEKQETDTSSKKRSTAKKEKKPKTTDPYTEYMNTIGQLTRKMRIDSGLEPDYDNLPIDQEFMDDLERTSAIALGIEIDPRKYPQTHSLRVQLYNAVLEEDYSAAEQLKNQILKTDQSLYSEK
ncbi:MAG: hypothetical protein V1725_01230 [archaeon]